MQSCGRCCKHCVSPCSNLINSSNEEQRISSQRSNLSLIPPSSSLRFSTILKTFDEHNGHLIFVLIPGVRKGAVSLLFFGSTALKKPVYYISLLVIYLSEDLILLSSFHLESRVEKAPKNRMLHLYSYFSLPIFKIPFCFGGNLSE